MAETDPPDRVLALALAEKLDEPLSLGITPHDGGSLWSRAMSRGVWLYSQQYRKDLAERLRDLATRPNLSSREGPVLIDWSQANNHDLRTAIKDARELISREAIDTERATVATSEAPNERGR